MYVAIDLAYVHVHTEVTRLGSITMCLNIVYLVFGQAACFKPVTRLIMTLCSLW